MKGLILIFLITFSLTVTAQEKRPVNQKFEYFLNIRGISSKTDIAAVESIFRSTPGVTYFETDKQTHKYFVLRTSRAFSQASVAGFLSNTTYTLATFAEDIASKESLVKQLH